MSTPADAQKPEDLDPRGNSAPRHAEPGPAAPAELYGRSETPAPYGSPDATHGTQNPASPYGQQQAQPSPYGQSPGASAASYGQSSAQGSVDPYGQASSYGQGSGASAASYGQSSAQGSVDPYGQASSYGQDSAAPHGQAAPPYTGSLQPGTAAPYGAPGGTPGYPAQQQGTGNLSLIGMILSIVGFIISLLPILGLPLGIAGVVLGFLGKGREPQRKGMWLTAIIVGFLAIGSAVIWFVIGAVLQISQSGL